MKLARLQGDWPALSALLDQALALPADERDGWLASLSGEQAPHRDNLACLLNPPQGIVTRDVLSTLPRFEAPAGEDGDALGALAPGDVIGPYRLLSELGQGGMGAVWLAERVDGQPRRKVALKLPHLGWTPGLAARLARERDILASLEHPNIARLYDAGLDALGRPYLALEYVAGLPIDRHCRTHALSLRQRLALVTQVAAAVAHAHTRLVVHRDLKPSNILVTESGDVRLLDFGIAKLLQDDEGEATELTRLAGRALTPDYASPEQIRGEAIGTASDVYSLGVVAYELASGARPYGLTKAGAGSLVEAIAKAEAPPASRATTDPALERQLAGDLDAILNKALKKDPAERYATVVAFAEDIERHLHHEPVAARPDRLGYRARKFVVRHAVQVSAGALVFAALLVGSGVALWQARQARFEAARAEQVKDFALSIFNGANADDSSAGAATTAVDLLKAAQAKVEDQLGERPETAVELMTAIGSGLLSQGQLDDAAALLRNAIDLSTRKLGPHHPRTLAATLSYGETLFELGRTKEDIALLIPAVDEARRQRSVPSQMQALRALSSAQLDLGDVDAGVASAQAAVNLIDTPGGGVGKNDAMSAWLSLANALGYAGRPGQAEAARHAVALTQEVFGDRISTRLLVARSHLAKGLAAEGRTAEGIDELAAALADSIRFLGPAHPETNVIANFLGNARFEAGDTRGAVEAFRIAVDAAEHIAGSNPTEQGTEHYCLAGALAASRQDEEALPHFETGARLLREGGGVDAPLALRALSARALVLARLGRLDEAERAFRDLSGAHFTEPDKALHAARLALLRSLQGRNEEATALARSSVEELATFPSPVIRAVAAKTLGVVLLAAGRPGEAVAPLQESVRLYAEKQIFMSPDRADAIAALDRAQKELAPAEPKPER